MSVAEVWVAIWQFPQGMDEGLIVTIARDVLRGLEYLHRHELAHRDLKVGNNLAPSSAEEKMLLSATARSTSESAKLRVPPRPCGVNGSAATLQQPAVLGLVFKCCDVTAVSSRPQSDVWCSIIEL